MGGGGGGGGGVKENKPKLIGQLVGHGLLHFDQSCNCRLLQF